VVRLIQPVFAGLYGGWGHAGAITMSAPKTRTHPASDPALKAATLRTADAEGARVAAERHGVPLNTVKSWRARARKRLEIVPYGAEVHGAYSKVQIGKRAELVHRSLLSVAPWVAEAHFAPAVSRYLEATAREQLAHQAILGMEPGAKGFTRLLETGTAAARLAAKLGQDLGLDPIGHARLKETAASAELGVQSLEELATKGAALRERREAERAQLAVDATATADDDPPGDLAPEQKGIT
jgi:transposase-like protein